MTRQFINDMKTVNSEFYSFFLVIFALFMKFRSWPINPMICICDLGTFLRINASKFV